MTPRTDARMPGPPGGGGHPAAAERWPVRTGTRPGPGPGTRRRRGLGLEQSKTEAATSVIDLMNLK